MKKSKRRNYTDEFKEESVKLVTEQHYKITEAARNLGGVQAKQKKKFKATTDSKHSMPVSQNLLRRDFHVLQQDRTWVGDITY